MEVVEIAASHNGVIVGVCTVGGRVGDRDQCVLKYLCVWQLDNFIRSQSSPFSEERNAAKPSRKWGTISGLVVKGDSTAAGSRATKVYTLSPSAYPPAHMIPIASGGLEKLVVKSFDHARDTCIDTAAVFESHPVTIIVGVQGSSLLRWEVSGLESHSKMYHATSGRNYMQQQQKQQQVQAEHAQISECELHSSTVGKLLLDAHGERTLTVETASTIAGSNTSLKARSSNGTSSSSLTLVNVRSETLRRIRSFSYQAIASTTTTGSTGSTGNAMTAGMPHLVDAVFAGEQDQYVVACFADGLIAGWNVAENSLVFTISASSGTMSSVLGIKSISGAACAPQCITAIPHLKTANDLSLSSGCFGIVIGFKDGKIKHYELFSMSGKSGRSTNRGEQQLPSAAVPVLSLQHREIASIDLDREMRFTSVGLAKQHQQNQQQQLQLQQLQADATGEPVGGLVGVRRELVLLPLAMQYIPSSRRSHSHSKTNTAAHTPSAAARSICAATSGDSIIAVPYAGLLQVVTPSAIIFTDIKTAKIVSVTDTESLGVSSITAAQCSLYTAPSSTSTATAHYDNDGDGDYEDDDDGLITGGTAPPNQALVVMHTAFERNIKMSTHAVLGSDARATSGTTAGGSASAATDGVHRPACSEYAVMKDCYSGVRKPIATTTGHGYVSGKSSSRGASHSNTGGEHGGHRFGSAAGSGGGEHGRHRFGSAGSDGGDDDDNNDDNISDATKYALQTAKLSDNAATSSDNRSLYADTAQPLSLFVMPGQVSSSSDNRSLYADTAQPLNLFVMPGQVSSSGGVIVAAAGQGSLRGRIGSSDEDDEDEDIAEGEGNSISKQQRQLRKSLLDCVFAPVGDKGSTVGGSGSSNTSKSRAKGDWEAPKVDKRTGKLVDQPITFHTRIKSSGYGQPPPSQSKFKRSASASAGARGGAGAAGGARVARRSSADSSDSSYSKMFDIMRQRQHADVSSEHGDDGDGGGGDSSVAPTGAAALKGAPGKASRLRNYPIDCDPMTLHQPHNNYPPVHLLASGASSKAKGLPRGGGSGAGASGSSCAAPIQDINYSSDGSLLGVATAEAAAIAVKLPVAKSSGETICFTGHGPRLVSVSFSHHKSALSSSSSTVKSASAGSGRRQQHRVSAVSSPQQYLTVSCGADATARVWRAGRTDAAAVVFSHTRASPGGTRPAISNTLLSPDSGSTARIIGGGVSGGGGSGGKGFGSAPSSSSSSSNGANRKKKMNVPFEGAVNYARFFFMDKFIVLSAKASVYMYTYSLDSPATLDDLKRPLAMGQYRLVKEWDHSSAAHNVTATACLNSTQSPLIFCATSDKTLNVLDAATGAIARQAASPHTRNIHCISLPQPSLYMPQLGQDAYNFFLTSAIDNVIALWDIRCPESIGRFSAHVNKREPVKCALSPCLRFFATGSEDRTVRVYDVRAGKEIARLSGHRDVVSSVAFNPIFPQLASASYDGTVRFYVDPYCDQSQAGL